MTRLLFLISYVYTFPLYFYWKFLLLLKHNGSIMFKEDLDYRYRSNSYCKGFFSLMYYVKPYRNLYYKRCGALSNLFRILVPLDSTFQIDGKVMPLGKCVWFEHSFRTIVHAKSIGNYFKIWHNCTIGSKNGKLPTIGDNVTILVMR